MVQKINLCYAYFRFFIDEDSISEGLNKYCKEWTKISGIGYNYKEYRCYTVNPGGMDTWAGKIQGYITPDRESAFLDGAPSSSVIDQTIIMGKTRIMAENEVEMLAAYGEDALCYFRKITACDSGTSHKVSFKSGSFQKINHPVMYTLDSSVVELIKTGSDGIVDMSDVDNYEIMVDIDKNCNTETPTVIEHPGVTVLNIQNMMNTDGDTCCTMSGQGSSSGSDYVIIDMLKSYNNVGIYGCNQPVGQTRVYIYTSTDGIDWVHIFNTGIMEGTWSLSKLNTPFRYIKFYFYTTTVQLFQADIRMLITT